MITTIFGRLKGTTIFSPGSKKNSRLLLSLNLKPFAGARERRFETPFTGALELNLDVFAVGK
jgi:hypothetical protein